MRAQLLLRGEIGVPDHGGDLELGEAGLRRLDLPERGVAVRGQLLRVLLPLEQGRIRLREPHGSRGDGSRRRRQDGFDGRRRPDRRRGRRCRRALVLRRHGADRGRGRRCDGGAAVAAGAAAAKPTA